MTRDFDLVAAMAFPAADAGSIPLPADNVAAALSSIDAAVGALRVTPPLPPAALTPADRLVAETTAA
jgi:hypothetical protein